MKRDDLIHPHVSGNKWRKLKNNLSKARSEGKKQLLTFGGAYSNHIAAVAFAARYYGFRSKGIIRGQELTENANPTLRNAAQQGMALEFVDRAKYREMTRGHMVADVNTYIIPEGGTNLSAVSGVAELIDEIEVDFDIITTPIGTGGTFCGLVKGLQGRKKVLGYSVLKGEGLPFEMQSMLNDMEIPWSNYEILTNYHFGGYARFDATLISFVNGFHDQFSIPLDPIYTGKMFYGVWDNIKNGQIAVGSRVLILHTGGLQGVDGFNERFPESAIRTKSGQI